MGARLFLGGDPRAADAIPAWSREGPPDPDAPTAVAARAGRIAWVGHDRDAAAWRGPKTEVLDARGGLVTPGFEDAHVHLRMGALALAQADLDGAASFGELARRLSAWQDAHADTSWVVGRGWHYGLFEGGLPDRGLLDRLVPDRPAVLEAFDGHTHWLNSRALAAAGITADSPDPGHGTIERDTETGEPSGILKEFAHELLADVLPRPSDAEIDDLLEEAIQAAHGRGVTAVQEAWTEIADLRRYRRLRDAGRLGIRLRVALPADDSGWRTDLDAGSRAWRERLHEYGAELARSKPDEWLSGGIVKAFADGVIESGTAWMLGPYESTAPGGVGTTGRPNWSPAALTAMTSIAADAGWQIEIHAIGDAAIRAALDAHQRATGTRGRVEHVEWPDPRDVPRFGSLGVIASMQPMHMLPGPGQAGVRRDAVGARTGRGWPWARILRTGGVVAFGSDWPIAPLDPLRHLRAAIEPRHPDSDPGRGEAAEQLGLAVALACATWGSAYAARAEATRGTLAVGKAADVSILDRDLLAEGPGALAGTSVRATIVDGRVVYRAG